MTILQNEGVKVTQGADIAVGPARPYDLSNVDFMERTIKAPEPLATTKSTNVLTASVEPNWAACLKRVAHELLSPMTTLRLTLQIGRGRLLRGEVVELATFDRALAQVDELSARVNRLCVAAYQSPPVAETVAGSSRTDATMAEENSERGSRPPAVPPLT